MLCGLAGSVLELRLCVKSSFESSGLGFSSNMLPRKLAMVCAKGTLDFREEVIFVMKVKLDNAHMCMYVLTYSYCICTCKSIRSCGTHTLYILCIYTYMRTRIYAHVCMPHACMYVSLPIFGMGLFQFGAVFFLRASQPKDIEQGFKTSHAS